MCGLFQKTSRTCSKNGVPIFALNPPPTAACVQRILGRGAAHRRWHERNASGELQRRYLHPTERA
jgi:hypothetical protein